MVAEVEAAVAGVKTSASEVRLGATTIGLFLIFLTPGLSLLGAGTWALRSGDVGRAACAFVSLGLLVYPMYLSARWRPGPWHWMLVTARYLGLPVLLGFALVPSSAPVQHRVAVWAVAFVVWAGLYEARRRSRGPPPDLGKTNSGFPALRIVIIADALPPKVDGVATFAEHAITLLQEYGHEVLVITSARGDGTDFFWGARVRRLPGISTPISHDHSVTLPLPSVMLELMRFQPHVVHMFEVSLLNLASFFYCHVVDVPCTFSHHTRLDLYVSLILGQVPLPLSLLVLSTMERFFFPLGDAHLTVSKALQERVAARGTHDVRRWSSGVSKHFDRSKASPERRRTMSGNAPASVPLVVYVGRLAPEKNSNELAEVFRLVTNKMGGQDKVRFALVGDGVFRARVEREMLDLGNVHFCGTLRGHPLHEAFASCDVFFSPSTTEGFPLVFLEAMASGLSVVGPQAGGVPDGFTDGVEGFLFPPHDRMAASEAIVKAIHEGPAMRERAYCHGKKFTWDRTVRELEEVLVEVAERQQAARRWGVWV